MKQNPRDASDTPGAIVSIDFEETFPHKFWISQWSADEAHPRGFRYKLLAVSAKSRPWIQIVVVLEERDGSKTEMKRMEVSTTGFDSVAGTFLHGLSEAYGLQFELLNLTGITDSITFEQIVRAAGWYEWEA